MSIFLVVKTLVERMMTKWDLIIGVDVVGSLCSLQHSPWLTIEPGDKAFSKLVSGGLTHIHTHTHTPRKATLDACVMLVQYSVRVERKPRVSNTRATEAARMENSRGVRERGFETKRHRVQIPEESIFQRPLPDAPLYCLLSLQYVTRRKFNHP